MGWRGIWLKLRSLLARSRVERELDEEVRFHLEMETEANLRRGLSPDEARREAYRSFGGVDRFKEKARDVRGTRWLEDAVRDARHALRSLRRNPGFTAAALLTVALGVGLNTAIYSVVAGTVLAPFPFPNADRLVALGSTLPERGWGFAALSIPELQEIRDEVRSFEEVAVFRSGVSVTLTSDGRAERLTATFATSSFLPLLGADPVQGRTFGPEADRGVGAHPVVVVSHGFWQSHLGGRPDAVGAELLLSGTPYTVVGVLPRGFRGVSTGPTGPSLWLPLTMGRPFFGVDMYETRSNRQYLGLARLAPHAEVEAARAELRALAAGLEELHPQSQTGRGFASWKLRRFFHGDLGAPLAVLFGGALLVLVVCAVNVGGLLLVRAAARRGEVALRTALGARRGRLLRQLLTEALVLALLGGAAGVAVTYWCLPLLLGAFEVSLPSFGEIGVDAHVFLVSLLAVTGVGVLFGLYPAVWGSRVSPSGALGSRAGGPGDGRSRLRRGMLVGTEVALAVVLLVGAGLTAKSLLRLADTEVGYEPAELLTLRMDLTGTVSEARRPLFMQRLLEEIRALPSVQDATVWGPSMLGDARWHVGVSPPEADPTDPETRLLAQRLLVSPGGLEALGVDLVRGRGLSEQDLAEGPGAVVIDERLAQAFWPGRDPLGERLPVSSSARPGGMFVVGVAERARHRGRLREDSEVVGDVYMLYADRPWATPSLLVRPRPGGGEPTALVEAVRGTVARMNPAVPLYDVARMSERLRREENTPRFTATLMAIYALTATLLALVGTYGVLAYTLRQRSRELAIRTALGAGPRELLRTAFREGLVPALSGTAVGVGVALALAGRVEGLLYGVGPTDVQTYGSVVLLVAATAAVAVFLPARRAAGVEPMSVLREE